MGWLPLCSRGVSAFRRGDPQGRRGSVGVCGEKGDGTRRTGQQHRPRSASMDGCMQENVGARPHFHFPSAFRLCRGGKGIECATVHVSCTMLRLVVKAAGCRVTCGMFWWASSCAR
eukprot:scaffold3025_cov132-Isochrysis_galbana.AAC.6